MSDFIGRTAELQRLDQLYAARESAFVPIYGRRRIGKSELIVRFLHGKPAVYFLGKQATPELQRREFLVEAAAALDEPLLATFPADTWKRAFDAVVERWGDRSVKGKGKLVIALDEFQWMVAESPELPSVLQEAWDRRWRATGNVFLILCGSYLGFMEREVLGKKSPLFGRRTAQILLRPFDHREAARFHPGYAPADLARTRAICGGVPMYLRCFLPGRSVEQNIKAAILDEYSPLHREPEFLLREELREVEHYYAILMTLATGAAPSGEIAQRAGIAGRSIAYYLGQLVELGYLRRRYPLTGKPPVARHVRYELDDPLLRFWFRFVYPNGSILQKLGPDQAFAVRIRPELDSYYGTSFERLCREALPSIYEREGVSAAYEIGEYWDKHTQIDLVSLRDDAWTDLGECKWRPVRSVGALLDELDAKVARYPNPRGASIGRRIFTRHTPRERAPKRSRGSWHSLDDFYE